MSRGVGAPSRTPVESDLSGYGTRWPVRFVILGDVTSEEITLTALNTQFIDAFRAGSWELLEPILSPRFQYLDGASGEVWPMAKYIDNLRGHPSPQLEIDEIVIHIDGDIAVVSARTTRGTGRYARYVDTYERRASGWACVHACLWPIV